MILRILQTVPLFWMMHCHFVYNDNLEQLYTNQQKERSPEYHGIGNINFLFNEDHTFYDKVFWIYLTVFVLYVIYIRAKTNFRIEYPDESESPFQYAIVSFRKIVAPDPYLDPGMRDQHLMSQFSNGPLIAFWILWYCIGFFSLDEMFGVTHIHIEDLTQLVIALFIYFMNIVSCCIIYDICVTSPMKYYEK